MMRGTLRQNEPLARYTSWRVGGAARQTYRPADLADLQSFLSTLPPQEPLIWLGLGSNVLIRDGGINGTVIITQGRLNQLEQLPDQTVRAEAGVTCAKMAKFCAKIGFSDAAFFAGVPGTIGGALTMNAGAFGGETWRYVKAVEMIDRTGKIHLRLPQDFKVSYRHVQRPPNEWFGAGHFIFPSGQSERAQQSIRELLAKRNASQPIGEFNCGSVFRNPEGGYAARLIEACGLKGFHVGDASVSEKHANFIINGGKATAADIEKLIKLVQQKVQEQHGVQLQTEVHIIGDAIACHPE